jgi:isoleucyl-tRNA synthetase
VDVAKRLGGEIIRLWVASVDFREDVAASENLMQRVSDNYRKLRNTLRFLLGNLHDFTPATDAVPFAAMEPLDRYILARLAELDAKIREAYDDFEFHRAYHALNEFTNTDLSALYLDVLKDRLYTFAPNAPARRSAQTALWKIAEALTRLVAPILSFTADEVWTLLPKVEGRAESVHLALFPDVMEIVPGNVTGLVAEWEQLLTLRDEVLKVLEEERAAKAIGKSSEARVTVGWLNGFGEEPTSDVFDRYAAYLPELFGTSQVTVSHAQAASVERGGFYVKAGAADGVKCERCWRFTEDNGQDGRFPTVCLRCAEALEAIGFAPYDKPENEMKNEEGAQA